METGGRVCTKYIICCLMSLMVSGGMMAVSGASGTSANSHDSTEALLKLMSGNVRFSSGQSTHSNISAERRKQVTTAGSILLQP